MDSVIWTLDLEDPATLEVAALKRFFGEHALFCVEINPVSIAIIDLANSRTLL